MTCFWRVQAGILATGLAALGVSGASCKSSTTSGSGGSGASCTSTAIAGTDTCAGDPCATALLASLPADASKVTSVELTSQGTTPCSQVPKSTTISDAAQAQSVFNAMLAQASAVSPCMGEATSVCECVEPTCATLAATLTLTFKAGSDQVVQLLVSTGQFPATAATFAQGGSFYPGNGFASALAGALGIDGSADVLSCCL
jgi:hypothetical protein